MNILSGIYNNFGENYNNFGFFVRDDKKFIF